LSNSGHIYPKSQSDPDNWRCG